MANPERSYEQPSAWSSPVAADVRAGLTKRPKTLPPYLFYDEAGSRLYERITELPEYYLTRTERRILEANADGIVARAAARSPGPLRIVELGAGSATKTEVLLRAVLRRQPSCVYVPIDVSPSAMDAAKARLREELPRVRVVPLVMPHAEAFDRLGRWEGPELALFIGSSVGNFEDHEAVRLLGGLAKGLSSSASLLLGTDLRKSSDVLLPAYDDARGVTAAFNLNLLVRLNRELGARFDLARFRHVARWNERASRVEMHLRSEIRQSVCIEALGLDVTFDEGETIHTESSIKYDEARVRRLLGASGFRLERTYVDDAGLFAVHFAGVA